MDIKKGRRKTFDIEYVVVDEDNIKEVATWSGGVVGGDGKDRYIRLDDKGAINTRQTKAFFGDVVVRHTDLNTFKSFGRKAFNKSYDTLDVIEHSRSSESGEYVSKEEALSHPETTVTERTEIPRDAGLS